MCWITKMPQQTYFDKFKILERTIVNKSYWGINSNNIDTGERDIFNIIRHIRNSISHKRFEHINENSYDITHIKIHDKVHRDDKEFSFVAKFPITDFKNFVINITEYALKNFTN